MNLTLTSTPQVLTQMIGSKAIKMRLWIGQTAGGVTVRCFIPAIWPAAGNAAEFREFKSLKAASDIFVSLSNVARYV